MLDAFKIKPFDLQPIYDEWKDGPVFNGNPKKDIPVEEWLDKIKEGCIKRGVPEEYWYKVAQHFMGPKARARLDELKEVIRKVHGGKYRWTWKKFRVAILNMGWNIDKSETRTIHWKSSWFGRKKDDSEESVHEVAEPETAKKDFAFPNLWPSRRGSVSETQHTDSAPHSHNRSHGRPVVRRAATEHVLSSETKHDPSARRPSTTRRPSSVRRPSPSSTRSRPESTTHTRPSSRKPSPRRAQTLQTTEIFTPGTSQNEGSKHNEGKNNEVAQAPAQAQAPVWLLNACNALDFMTSEHPKAMSVLSAILITVGSIPAIPAISAGAGGVVLASGAAHAIGAIAVGVGQAISMTVKNSQSNQNNQQNQNQITNGAQHS